METKFITLDIERPLTRQEIRQRRAETRAKVIIAALVGVILALSIGLAIMSLTATAVVAADIPAKAPESLSEPPHVSVVQVPAPGAYEPTAETEAGRQGQFDLVLEDALTETLNEMIAEDELELLALVIYQEAGMDSCSNETRRMVGEVALNRVASSRYPDTLAEVLTQKQQYGTLYWTGLKWPDRASNPGEAHAVARAYECARQVLTEPRLLPEDTIYQAEFKQGTVTVAQVPGFYFCK